MEKQDKQSQRIFQKPANFMGNDAVMNTCNFRKGSFGGKKSLNIESLQFYLNSNTTYRGCTKFMLILTLFLITWRIHGEYDIFIWNPKYHKDQHSAEHFAEVHLIDHSATHFQKTEILIITNPEAKTVQYVFKLTWDAAKFQLT